MLITFEKHLRMGASCQENQSRNWGFGTFGAPPLSSWDVRGLEAESIAKANDLTNHAYVRKPQ